MGANGEQSEPGERRRHVRQMLKGVCAGAMSSFFAVILVAALTGAGAVLVVLVFTLEGVQWLTPRSNGHFAIVGFCISALPLLLAGYVAAGLADRRRLLAGFLAGFACNLLWAALMCLLIGAFVLFGTIPYRYWLTYRSASWWLGVLCMSVIAGGLVSGGVAMLGAILQAALTRRSLDVRARRAARKWVTYAALLSGLFFIALAVLLTVLYPGDFKPPELLNLGGLTVLGIVLFVYSIFRLPKLHGSVKGIFHSPALYVVLAVLLVLVVTVIVRDRTNRPRAERILAVSKEINSFYAVPESENGAFVFLEILDIDWTYDFLEVAADRDRSWKGADHPEWAAWIREQQDVLDTAVRAAEYEHVYFPLALSEHYLGYNTEILAAARRLARILRFAAFGRLGEGDVAGALRYLNASFRLGEGFSSRGGTVDLLIGQVCRHVSLTVIAATLQQSELSEEELLLICERLEHWAAPTFPDPSSWPWRAKLETAQYVEEFLGTMREDGVGSYFSVLCLRRDWFGDITNAVWEPLLKEKTVKAMWQKASQIQRQLDDKWKRDQGMTPFEKMELGLKAMFLPSTGRVFKQVLIHRARLGVLRGYAAASHYRAGHGEPPSGWDDLVPDYLSQPPSDPFSDEPLRMVSTENDLKIYSIGPDGADQGGEGDPFDGPSVGNSQGEPAGDDICLVLERKP